MDDTPAHNTRLRVRREALLDEDRSSEWTVCGQGYEDSYTELEDSSSTIQSTPEESPSKELYPLSMIVSVAKYNALLDGRIILEEAFPHVAGATPKLIHPEITKNNPSELCERAQSWANHLAHTNSFFYKADKDVGQNLFCRLTNSLQYDVTGQEVASYWYSAVRQYNYFKEPDVLHANVNAGHFTQMVWACTQRFGVGKASSRSGKVLVVAYYWPPGNISGHFQDNVLPPLPECETDSVSGSDSSTSRSVEAS